MKAISLKLTFIAQTFLLTLKLYRFIAPKLSYYGYYDGTWKNCLTWKCIERHQSQKWQAPGCLHCSAHPFWWSCQGKEPWPTHPGHQHYGCSHTSPTPWQPAIPHAGASGATSCCRRYMFEMPRASGPKCPKDTSRWSYIIYLDHPNLIPHALHIQHHPVLLKFGPFDIWTPRPNHSDQISVPVRPKSEGPDPSHQKIGLPKAEWIELLWGVWKLFSKSSQVIDS